MTSTASDEELRIAALFREKGIPYTRQRHLIWEFFADGDRAATIAERALLPFIRGK